MRFLQFSVLFQPAGGRTKCVLNEAGGGVMAMIPLDIAIET